MSNILVEEETQYPFILPELESTEVEKILRAKPEIAKKFIEKMAKGEIGWEDFNPHERGLLLHGAVESSYKNADEISVIKSLREADWLRTPPTIEEFLENPKYLGREISSSLYKPWKEDLKYVLDPKNEIYSWVLSGSIGCGKTRISIIAQLYKLAVLTCLKNINEYLGLDNATQISFGLFSLSLDKVEGALSDDFKKIISNSPYFKNVFPLKKARTAKRVLNNQSTFGAAGMAEYEVLLPQNLRILLGSKISHALSLAVVSAILDEMNFRGKRTLSEEDDVDSAENLYNQIRYRITSRFERLGFLPGLLCVISSRTSTSGFIEAHIAKIDGGLSSRTGSWIAKNDPHCFISSYSQWDVKPDNYSKEKFHVFIGSSKTSSRILTEEEYKTFPENSPSLLAVPVSARPHFENDINAALRELAGISSSPTHLLFEDPVIVKNVWNMNRPNPFKEEIIPIGLKTHLPISAYLKEEEIFYDAGFSLTPKHHPDMLRVIHIDLSKNKDLTGITMAGVSSLKEYRGRNLVGETITNAITPQIFVDFSIGLKAPQGDQIDYEKIQQFISFLRKMGFNIFLVTFDQFACLTEKTLINTHRGLVSINEIKIGDIVESKSGPNKVIDLFNYGKQKTIKITTTDGDIIEGTYNHKLEFVKEWKTILRKDRPAKIRKLGKVSKQTEWRRKTGKAVFKKPIYDWCRLDELKLGDTLSMSVNANAFNNRQNYPLIGTKKECGYTTQAVQNFISRWEPPNQMTPELAEFLGLLWGDGHIGKNHLALTVTDWEEESAKQVFLNLFGAYPECYKRVIHKDRIFGVLRIESRWFLRWLKLNNLIKPIIPKAILESSRLIQASFLKALFATDGSVSKNDGAISFSTKHKELADQIRILLRTEFELESSLTTIDKEKYPLTKGNGFQYVVIIRGSRNKFLEQIGFSYNNKTKKLENFKNIQGRFLYTKVKSIELSENEVFDLQVENDPSYIANGFISHNSVGPMQMLVKDGFTVDNLSVDRTDTPYRFLRDIVSKKNIDMPYSKTLEREMLNLLYIHGEGKSKVDHPKMTPDGHMGGKDICDSLAGSVANCVAILTNTKKYPYTANANIAGRLLIGDNSLVKEIGPSQVDSRSNSENHDIESFINSVDPFKHLKG
jgi:hypothetical protein